METDRTMASALFQNGSFHRMQSGTVCLCNEKKQGESQNSADSDIFNKKFPPRHLSKVKFR